MSPPSESITLEQLADHNTLGSLWIAVHGFVYDLTTFSQDHPGGIEALESCAGTDGTEPYDYAGHSESNMAKMQQYRIGRLAGSLEQVSLTSHNPLAVDSQRARSATSRLKKLRFFRWTKLAVTISATSLPAVFAYQQRDSFVDYISPMLNVSKLQFRTISNQNVGNSFWAGMTVASLVSCVGFRYLYKQFLFTLDYENDVFNFPPTIPRRTKT